MFKVCIIVQHFRNLQYIPQIRGCKSNTSLLLLYNGYRDVISWKGGTSYILDAFVDDIGRSHWRDPVLLLQHLHFELSQIGQIKYVYHIDGWKTLWEKCIILCIVGVCMPCESILHTGYEAFCLHTVRNERQNPWSMRLSRI